MNGAELSKLIQVPSGRHKAGMVPCRLVTNKHTGRTADGQPKLENDKGHPYIAGYAKIAEYCHCLCKNLPSAFVEKTEDADERTGGHLHARD
jgi:hypothetical protein